MTPNGKVDRAALRAIEPARTAMGSSTGGPRSSTEERLIAVWREVLQLETFGVEEDFFDLGGGSLLLLRTLGPVRAAMAVGAELSVVDLFSHPTIRTLANHRRSRSPDPTRNWSPTSA